MDFLMRVAILAIVLVLFGCGGGGSSPIVRPSYNPPIQPSYPVPYYTPTKAGYITPLATTSEDYSWAIVDLHTEKLTSSGDNLIVTGFKSQPANESNWKDFNISIYGWQNNKLVDQTSTWFTAQENKIVGAHTAKFADLDNNGRLDMVVAPYTDGVTTIKHPAYAYFNNPNNSFTRATIDINIAPSELARADSKNHVEAHDIAIADLDNDGHKDIIIGDYGWNTALAFNQGNRTFVTYTQQYRSLPGMSSLAVADFLNNGTKTILAVDQGNSQGNSYNEPGLYSWNIDGSDNLNFSLISLGPKPRFELPKWASYNFSGGIPGSAGHNVRVIAYDWNDNGVMDAIVLSRPTRNLVDGWPKFSEIQFLKNDGHGNFTDETDNVVVGYNTNTVVSYNPKFVDINGDGLVDILLPTAGDFYQNNSSQILLKTSDGKYMAAYQNVLTDFSAQTNAIANHPNVGNTLNVLRGPDDKLYLITAVKLSNNQMAVYLGLIGDSFVNAAQAISTVQARWPWMSDATANTVLSQTSKTYLNGDVIDLDAALSPIGGLQIKHLPVTGYISGIKIESVQLPVQALDSLGRNFAINISPSVINDSNFWSRNYVPDQVTPRSQTEYLIGGSNYEYSSMRFGGNNSVWSIGTSLLPINESLSVSAQITTLNYNPWIQLSGMWGSINYSSMFESTVTYKKSDWQNQIGYILTTSDINPGLITKVDNFHAVWLETGYATKRFGFFTGVRPWIVNGSVNAELPTGIDTQGNIQYTNTHFKINNPVNMYLRTVYTDTITKNIAYKISGMFVDNGQYRTQLELKYFY
jgi:hypothetical protein